MTQPDPREIENLFDRLWPICRSITGNGLRESLRILQEIIPLELTEVKTGTKVFDWEVPREWNISDAYIITPAGQKICDFKVNNLHVVNYSAGIDRSMSFSELEAHLHYREDMPSAIPYVTSYYRESWGFSLSYDQFKTLPREGSYKVVIDASLKDGSLTYGEYLLPGKSSDEILFSTYVCHPSMANNELSGPLVAAFLYRSLASIPERKYSYRFVFAPETIGIIAYLVRYGDHFRKNLLAGYVITCAGDAGKFHYKRSKQGRSIADRVAEHVLRFAQREYEIIDFAVGGSDERQYCSPGFNLPVGSLMRTPYQRYPEYHTSLDNKDVISFEAIAGTVEMYMKIARTFELNEKYENTIKYCEPQLGKRGLYALQGGTWDSGVEVTRDILHVLAFADGDTDLIEIAERRGKPCLHFEPMVKVLEEKGLLKR